MTVQTRDDNIEKIAWSMRELSEAVNEVSPYAIVSSDILESLTGEVISEEDAGDVKRMLDEKNW